MKSISIVTPCYNEVDNVEELHDRIALQMAQFPELGYEHLFIDNASTDGTVDRLRLLALRDPSVKVIVNARNFGHIRSPMHGMLEARGDAVLEMASDLQDPPELIPEMIRHWLAGTPIVIGIKVSSDESRLMYFLRSRYYKLVRRLAEMETFEHFTGFGIYDRSVMEAVREFDDPYPYFRGMIAEIGLPCVRIPYHQKQRKRGFTKNNLYTLYDMAMLGITGYSKAPLRLFTFFGFFCSFASILVALGYLVYKLVFWDRFTVGMAPVAIGLFFFSSVQLMFIGLLGEYVASVHTQVVKRPLVIEKERINFQERPKAAAQAAR